ncbi:RhoGEF for Cdc42/Rho3/Rho4 (Gef3) [Schizosaccharomyces osmophilus]|uniref:RhoGEF for Cdc42/Rho3/Rho4 (Gef3) n=1 Tax=Schizosaccharomyces osmophilus TaxID=2545709 RepID=A0AAE9W8N8_9SCHI|nr:RhoGEF for Cdc42/Rho3/Rho4 (Gef3) [Schizosaccharomyces osmophilus]WBW71729.1 RhoGEF for Cdc42/Rho3/Rho4 (Gef3) [Schizosaccharomyces osmophilus]
MSIPKMFQSRGKRIASDTFPVTSFSCSLDETFAVRRESYPFGQQDSENQSLASISVKTEPILRSKDKQKTVLAVLLEYRDSEAAYVHDLHVARRYYAERLNGHVKKSEWKKVFHVFLELCQQATLFESEISKAFDEEIANMTEDIQVSVRLKPSVAKIFLKWLPKLSSVYSRYCLDQDEIVTIVDKWSNSPSMSDYLQECDSMAKIESKSWNLDSFLVKPMQRFLKYPLLLNQLYKSACLGMIQDYVLLGEACHQSELASQRANEMKRRRDIVVDALKAVTDTQEILVLSTDTISKKISKLKTSINVFYIPEHEYIVSLIQDLFSSYSHLVELRTSICEWIKYSRMHYTHMHAFVDSYVRFCKETPSIQKWVPISLELQNIAKGAILCLIEQCQKDVLKPMSKAIHYCRNPLYIADVWIQRASAFSKRRHSGLTIEADLESFPLLSNCLLEELPTLLSLARSTTDECIVAFSKSQATFYATVTKSLTPFVSLFSTVNFSNLRAIENLMDQTVNNSTKLV